MGITASKVIALAQSWLGKKEADNTFRYIIDLYNTIKPLPVGYKVQYTDEWCATTVSALFKYFNATDIMFPECSCNRMIAGLQKQGRWIEDESITPQPGDIIFYDWQDPANHAADNKGTSEHVGIVESVANGKINVIEGNNGCAVKRRTIDVNGRYIRGFGRPAYDAEPVVTPPPAPAPAPTPVQSAKPDVFYSVRVKGGRIYPEVKNLNNVNSNGFAGVDGEAITDIAIRVTQGTVKYRVHVLGGNWLPYVTGCDWRDAHNGYAGNGKVIDAIEVITSVGKAHYRVSDTARGAGYAPFVVQNEDYAGNFGKAMDKVQIEIV